MCGIVGVVGKDGVTKVTEMLEVIKHRGPDGSGIYSSGEITIGSVQLRLTGNSPQPLSNKGTLVYNGEIYNFKEIAESLNLTTDSDTHVLLNLIEAIGVENAVKQIDGDYAFAYLVDKKLYLARDLVGVKPLYYCNDNGFAFASEKKALLRIGAKEIHSLKPGHVMVYEEDKVTEKKMCDFCAGEKIYNEGIASAMLYKKIQHAVKKRIFEPCAIAFSGGLDSSFIAALCPEAELYCAGLENSHDLIQAKKAAKLLGLSEKLHLLTLTLEEVEQAIPYVMKAVESSDVMKIGIAMPLFFVSKEAHDDGIRVMLSGQGADELFAGYKRYEDMKPKELELALINDLRNIAENNLERDDATAMANSVELRLPYLDKEVVSLALHIAPELKIRNKVRKYILRISALHTLHKELVWKEKKAAQYSSGMYLAFKKIARKNGYVGKGGVWRYMQSLYRTIV